LSSCDISLHKPCLGIPRETGRGDSLGTHRDGTWKQTSRDWADLESARKESPGQEIAGELLYMAYAPGGA